MDIKYCSKCNQSKALDEFNKKGNGKQVHCRDCTKTLGRNYYIENKQYYLKKTTRRKNALRDIIKASKNVPCTDCKQNYPSYVMDFDHIEDKQYLISSLPKSGSKQKLINEIAKCEVVCANCHRERTHQRYNQELLDKV